QPPQRLLAHRLQRKPQSFGHERIGCFAAFLCCLPQHLDEVCRKMEGELLCCPRRHRLSSRTACLAHWKASSRSAYAIMRVLQAAVKSPTRPRVSSPGTAFVLTFGSRPGKRWPPPEVPGQP